ncbi:hypothetical protein [Acinetobacter sp. WZC-1]|uniref:hypothetical protein n=1 Tax=Acinetobacter sp. WZC-1 TaxID=3459034 RepID=UPI00403D6536
MFKQIAMVVAGLGLALQVQAFEKTQMNLDKDFWGTWSIYNAKNKCTEVYQFQKPGQFQYSSKQKNMTGRFAVTRNSKDARALDVLSLKVLQDNKKASCAEAAKDYNNASLNMALKWVSANTAQICTDTEAKSCTSLYLIKQK